MAPKQHVAEWGNGESGGGNGGVCKRKGTKQGKTLNGKRKQKLKEENKTKTKNSEADPEETRQERQKALFLSKYIRVTPPINTNGTKSSQGKKERHWSLNPDVE